MVIVIAMEKGKISGGNMLKAFFHPLLVQQKELPLQFSKDLGFCSTKTQGLDQQRSKSEGTLEAGMSWYDLVLRSFFFFFFFFF